MENYGFKETDVSLAKIALNGQGDHVVVSADDPVMFDRFAAGYKHIVELADSIPGKLEEIEKRFEGKEGFTDIMEKTVAMSKVNVGFSKEAAAVIDGILGEGAVRKHFHNAYKEIPDFLPDADCFMTFLEKLTPVMEKIFNRKMERMETASKARMAKYQPRDHRPPYQGRRNGHKRSGR